MLESVLKRDPNHPGANHFYIHAVEASPNLERAIPSAERLMTLVPGAGHLVHMPGHIFLQTGDYELAAKTNVNASQADKAFVERTGATGVYPLMYWTHNIHFISYARAQQGRYDEARQAAQEMARNVGAADLQMQMLEGFHLYPLMVDLRFHRWDDILKAADPGPERKLHRAFRHYARAMALAGQGKLAEAAAERKQFGSLRKAVPPQSQFIINNKSSDILALAAATLDAQFAWARGEKEKSLEEWRRAVKLESKIQYDEPPAWFYPVRQSLAAMLAALLMIDRLGKGIRTAPRDALITQSSEPSRLGAAFGLHRTLDTAGAALGPVVAFAVLAAAPGAYDAVFVVSLAVALVGLAILGLFVEDRRDQPEPAVAGASARARLGAVLAGRRFLALVVAGGLLGLVTASDALIYLLPRSMPTTARSASRPWPIRRRRGSCRRSAASACTWPPAGACASRQIEASSPAIKPCSSTGPSTRWPSYPWRVRRAAYRWHRTEDGQRPPCSSPGTPTRPPDSRPGPQS